MTKQPSKHLSYHLTAISGLAMMIDSTSSSEHPMPKRIFTLGFDSPASVLLAVFEADCESKDSR